MSVAQLMNFRPGLVTAVFGWLGAAALSAPGSGFTLWHVLVLLMVMVPGEYCLMDMLAR